MDVFPHKCGQGVRKQTKSAVSVLSNLNLQVKSQKRPYYLYFEKDLERLDDLCEEGCHLVGSGVCCYDNVISVVYIVFSVVVVSLVRDD